MEQTTETDTWYAGDLGRMRAQALALSLEMGRMERRLRHVLREEV